MRKRDGRRHSVTHSWPSVLFFMLLFLVLTLYFYANNTSISIFDSFPCFLNCLPQDTLHILKFSIHPLESCTDSTKYIPALIFPSHFWNQYHHSYGLTNRTTVITDPPPSSTLSSFRSLFVRSPVILHQKIIWICVEYLGQVFQTRRTVWHKNRPWHPCYWNRLIWHMIFARLVLDRMNTTR